MAVHGASILTIPVGPRTTDFPPIKGHWGIQFTGLSSALGAQVAAINYRMRGFDENVSVNSTVYWTSTEVDADASEYTGSAGPVINIVVNDIVGA